MTPVAPIGPPMTSNGEASSPWLDDLIDALSKRIQAGEAVDAEAVVAAHPEHADELRRVLPAIQALAGLSPEAAAGGQGEPLGELGDYQILREVGRGGMGVVYEAHQLSLGRRVALKVLPFAAALDARQLQRFKNEAQAAAHLHHTSIVPVYAVGCERGVHYYAMQFIDGHTLAGMIREQRQFSGLEASATRAPDDPRVTDPYSPPAGPAAPTVALLSTERSAGTAAFVRTAAHLGVQAALALEHAHQLGVVHRDIKPSNLLVDGRGNLWITDFGLAHCQSQAGLTMTGDLVGTLRYMSPEQALAKRVVVDHRTDVYSLGATLYELLTLEPAFAGSDRQELLRQIAFEEPRPARQLNKAIPAELETILHKALEKNPADRYATAQELADDLDRFLKDEPIRARRPSLLQVARKWARRHRPVVVSAIVATAAVLAISIVALMISYGNISAALTEKNAALEEKSAALEGKSAALEREKGTTYLRGIALAGRELAAGNVGRAEELLGDCPEHLRGWEWHFLKRQRYDGQPTPLPHSATVTRVAFSPDGRQLASVCYDGTLQIWDAQTHKVLHTLERQMARGRSVIVRDLVYSPDSRYLALARHDGGVRVWDAPRGQPLHTLKGHEGLAWGVAFSPDSRTLASCGSDRSVRLWDMTSGQALQPFSDHPAAVKAVAFRPDGRSVLAACDDGTVQTWDRGTGRATVSFRGELPDPFLAWFSPDARRLGWSCMGGVIKVWDTTTGKVEIDQQGSPWQCRAIVFNPDGKRIALAGFDGTLRLLDASNGREMLTIFAHPLVVAYAAFSHDGKKLASASYDHTVRIWDASPLEGDPQTDRCRTLTGHKQLVSGVAYSPDGRWLSSSSWDGTVIVWEVCRSRHAPGDGSGTLHAGGDGYTLRYTLRGHSGNVSAVAISADSRTLASAGWDKTVKLWDLQAPRGDSLTELRTISCTERVTGIAFSPDGRLLAIGQMTGIGLYDPASGKEVAPFKRTPAAVPALAFSPDSRHLCSAGASDPAIKFWDVAANKMNFEIPHPSSPNGSVSISPDGRLIAAPGPLEAAGPTVKIWEVLDWDVRTSKTPYQARHTLRGHVGYVWRVAFSPDGRYLASGSWDSTIQIWDLKALEMDPQAKPVTLRGHAGFIYGLAFSPDGRCLATGSGSARHGEVKVWDASLWDDRAKRGR